MYSFCVHLSTILLLLSFLTRKMALPFASWRCEADFISSLGRSFAVQRKVMIMKTGKRKKK